MKHDCTVALHSSDHFVCVCGGGAAAAAAAARDAAPAVTNSSSFITVGVQLVLVFILYVYL